MYLLTFRLYVYLPNYNLYVTPLFTDSSSMSKFVIVRLVGYSTIKFLLYD